MVLKNLTGLLATSKMAPNDLHVSVVICLCHPIPPLCDVPSHFLSWITQCGEREVPDHEKSYEEGW